MKNFIIFLLVAAVIGAACFYAWPIVKKMGRVKISDINYFEYTYTVGYEKDSNVAYKIECNSNNTCTATVKLKGMAQEDEIVQLVDDHFMTKLEHILIDHNVGDWNGFYKINKRILDGDSFTMKVKMNNNKKIEAHGYMSWTNHYGEAKDEIDKL